MQPVPTRPSGMRRVAAIVALSATAAFATAVVILLLHNGIHLIFGLIGMSVTAVGAWWVITERSPLRMVGAGSMGVGMVVMIGALTRAFTTSDSLGWHLVIVIGLVIVASGATRVALVPSLHAMDTDTVEQPRHPVLICNPRSGGGKVDRFELPDLAARHGVEVVILHPDDDLEQLARDAIDRGADCLAMAGGDGSQALVAGIAAAHDLPFVCVTAGTRNHFALDLGLDRNDPRRTLTALWDGIERRVDYASVNGRVFVNNVSLGVYATLVQEDSYRNAKAHTAATLLPDMLGRTAEPFDLQYTTPDDHEIDGSFMILVSNNPYRPTASLDAATRERLDTGQLGVIAVSTSTGPEAARLVAMTAIGLRRANPSWQEFTTPAFEVRSRSGQAFAGIDGEACDLSTPLRFTVHHKGLRMRVPRDNPAAVARHRARHVQVHALVDVAAGRVPRM